MAPTAPTQPMPSAAQSRVLAKMREIEKRTGRRATLHEIAAELHVAVPTVHKHMMALWGSNLVMRFRARGGYGYTTI